MDEDDDPGAKLIWCVLESPCCPLSATDTRFTSKGRRRQNRSPNGEGGCG